MIGLLLFSMSLDSTLAKVDSLYQISWKDTSAFETAYSILDSLLKTDPENPEIVWRYAYFCYNKGSDAKDKKKRMEWFIRGKEICEKLLKKYPENAELHYWHAVNRAKEGETRGVMSSLFMVDDLKKEANLVLKLNPKHAGAHVLLGGIFDALPGFAGGSRDKAIQHYKQAIQNDSTYVAAYTRLAEDLIKKRKYDEAREILQKLLNLKNPNDARLYYLKDRPKAEKMLKELEGKK